MSRTRRLTQTERAEIIREAAAGVGTSALAERFGVTPRAIQYTLKADEERQKDAAVATAAVTVKLTPEELAALAEMARYRASLHEVGNGVVQVAKQMMKASREGQGEGSAPNAELSELRLAQMRGLARFILDSADEIDLLLRRRRDGMRLSATAALREFAHAAE